MNKVIKSISEYIYKYFVINTYAAGIQQNDGRYITKYFAMSPYVIENMLLTRGSMGCYQQGYKTGKIRWICFDFDCENKRNPDLNKLYEQVVKKVVLVLNELNINYFLEYSGRRGIHIWIIFNYIFDKKIGYDMINLILKKSMLINSKAEIKWNLDKFPATDSSLGNKVGKQVKFPLSCHRSGEQSYFFQGKFNYRVDCGEKSFWNDQLEILKEYEENDFFEVAKKLGISLKKQRIYDYKYKKYKVGEDIEVSIEKVEKILSETTVFKNIFKRMKRGQAKPEDWLVLLGTLSRCDSRAELLKNLFKTFPNYDEDITQLNIDKRWNEYYPASFGYLYEIYNLKIEKNINPNDTGFDYLLTKLGVDERNYKILKDFQVKNTKNIEISDTVTKEERYLLYNDEVPNMLIWNELQSIYKYDLEKYKEIISQIIKGDKNIFVPQNYRVYIREEGTKRRKLVSLSARDRVISTHLILLLCKKVKRNWNSYSYHISLMSSKNIFYPWFSSWERYIRQIKTYIEVPFFNEFSLFFIDLKGFYDHIDFLSVYRKFEGELEKEVKNIFMELINYNDLLMKKLNNGMRIGVPQGPAYARVIAEIYLDGIINEVLPDSIIGIEVLRYVDDIVIVCPPDFDAESLYEKMICKFEECGLPINEDKSKFIGKISDMTKKHKELVLHSDKLNYDLQEDYFTDILLPEEKRQNLYTYIQRHDFSVNSLSYIFGNKTIKIAQEWCMTEHIEDILESYNERGSNYRKFYEFLYMNDKYINSIVEKEEFGLIPINSLNFKNMMHILYLYVYIQKVSSHAFELIRENYLKYLDINYLEDDEKFIVEALRLINKEETWEKKI